MEETMPHSNGTGDEAKSSVEVGEIEANEVDKPVGRSETIEGVEAVGIVEQAQPVESAGVDGGAKKKSFRSWVGDVVKRTRDRLMKKDLDKTSASRLDFDRRLEAATRQMREDALEERKQLLKDLDVKVQQMRDAALEDRKGMQRDFDDKVQQMKVATASHTTHMVEKTVKEIEKVALRKQAENSEDSRRMEESVERHRAKEAADAHLLRVKQQARSKLGVLNAEDDESREHVVAVEPPRESGFLELMANLQHKEFPSRPRPATNGQGSAKTPPADG